MTSLITCNESKYAIAATSFMSVKTIYVRFNLYHYSDMWNFMCHRVA